MAIELTTRTQRALGEVGIEPNIALKIDGLETVFSTQPVLDLIQIGCPDLFIDSYLGDSWFIGGFKQIENNKTYIDSRNTTYTIRQQINHDENKSSSISQMTIGLVDKDQEVTKLISPGQDLPDMIGRQVQVLVGFGTASFFEDYIEVFKGFITKISSGSGLIKINLNHPDNKKNVRLFQNVATSNPATILPTDTSIPVSSTDTFLLPTGPVTTYIRVNEEIITYTGTAGNTFTGVTRGALGTTAANHDANSQVKSLYALAGNPFDLALELMLSGHGTDPVFEDLSVTSFVKIGPGNDQIANAIFFRGVNIPRDFGIQIGDTITTTGAANGANNVTTRAITDIQLFKDGYYIVVDGAALTYEEESSALMNVFTQYNTMPDGMKMRPNDVDIEQHIRLRDFFHSSTEMLIYIKEDEIEGKEFLDEQLYRPISAYSIPRKARSSVNYTVGPIPGEFIKTINSTNVKNPKNVTIERSSNRSFFNEVVYKFEDSPAAAQELFTRGKVTISQTSKDRTNDNTKTWVVESLGLRDSLNAQNLVDSASTRILDRYKFGAERIIFQMLLRDSIDLDLGDIVIFDGKDLQVSDITIGSRLFEKRLLEILNKSTNLKNGQVEVVALDTGININTRFGLMSPCSLVSGVISSSQFTIGPDPNYISKFGQDEYRKWLSTVDQNSPASILIHNADYSIQEDLVLKSIDESLFTLETPATITLSAGMIVEFTGYEDDDTSDKQKLVWAYMTDSATFPGGENQYSMI